MASALIVEDDLATMQLIADHLQQAGLRVDYAHEGNTGLRLALEAQPELVLLDWMLPAMSGPELCRAIRQSGGVQPIIVMITARSDEQDVLEGFSAGIDDYVRKPFGVRELMCRLSALLRLSTRGQPSSLQRTLGAVSIDEQRRIAAVQGAFLNLTPKEFDLLAHFVAHPGELLSREQLLVSVWGYRHSGYARTVDSHVTRLRRKLLQAGVDQEVISTVHRLGYRFCAPSART